MCSLLVSLFGLRQPSPVVYRLYGRANTIGIPPRGIKPTDTSQDPCCQCPYPRGRPLPTHTSLRPSDTQRQVWLGLLGGHYSFPLGPGAHNVSFVPPNSLCFPQSCGSSVIKFCCPPKGFSAPSPDPQVGKSDVWPEFLSSARASLVFMFSGRYGNQF